MRKHAHACEYNQTLARVYWKVIIAGGEKMKVAELEGVGLDYWVAIANGDMRDQHVDPADFSAISVEEFGRLRLDKGHYSTDWAHGGPIIERAAINIAMKPNGIWMACHSKNANTISNGPTPLIAAMRCFVASKFGEEVKEPNAETQAAMIEARSIKEGRFNTADELFNDLDKGIKE
jgi:hypothetical protein